VKRIGVVLEHAFDAAAARGDHAQGRELTADRDRDLGAPGGFGPGRGLPNSLLGKLVLVAKGQVQDQVRDAPDPQVPERVGAPGADARYVGDVGGQRYHGSVSLLPFEPDDALGAEPPSEDRSGPLTVSDVAALIKSTLEQHTPSPLAVIGQVSNLSCRGHWYFSLKDESAVVGCVAWSSTPPRPGASVSSPKTAPRSSPRAT
jgi:hypothetical protein